MAAKKPAAKKPATRRRAPAKPKAGLHDRGARVVSVGPFGCSAMVEMPVALAQELFGDKPLGDAGPHDVVDAILRDLEPMPENLATSALAMAALALGREIEHPHNSATSKSMCVARLTEILAELRALAPPERKVDSIDRIAAQREKRQAAVAAGSPAPANLPRT
jgi:hypothetical protein